MVDEFGLDIYDMGEEWQLQLANDIITKVSQYCWIPVNVGGVLAYILGDRDLYDLLLSKRWMRRVSTVEDHGQNTFSTQAEDGIERTIYGQPTSSTRAEIVGGIHSLHDHEEELVRGDLEALVDEPDKYESQLDHTAAT